MYIRMYTSKTAEKGSTFNATFNAYRQLDPNNANGKTLTGCHNGSNLLAVRTSFKHTSTIESQHYIINCYNIISSLSYYPQDLKKIT